MGSFVVGLFGSQGSYVTLGVRLPNCTCRIVAGVPVIALFTLFELVIFNPKHHETRGNLALLDVAGGYFSRLEYASNGSLPSSLVSEFAYIAREYVNGLQRTETTRAHPSPPHHPPPRQNSRSMSGTAMALRSSSSEKDFMGGRPDQQEDPVQTTHESMVPDVPAVQGPPMLDSGGIIAVESPSPMSMDGLNFPMDEVTWNMNSDFLLGTDVMDLFNYSLPSMDPFFT